MIPAEELIQCTCMDINLVTLENSNCDFAGWMISDRIRFIRNWVPDQKKQWKTFWTSVSCFAIHQAVGVECDQKGAMNSFHKYSNHY